MGLKELIVHHFCTAAVTHMLLSGEHSILKRLNKYISGFKRKNRGHITAEYSLVAIIASVLFYFEVPYIDDTLYATLGLSNNVNHYDIISLYTRFKAHVNRHGPPDNFDTIKKAFEILIDEEARSTYNRFGDMDLETVSAANFPTVIAALALSYQALSCILCCTLNRSNQLRFTRCGIILFNAIVFALEVESRFVKQGTLLSDVFFFRELLPFQRIQLLRSIAPSLTLFFNIVASHFCLDSEKANLALWQSTLNSNGVIVEKMADVVNATNYIKSLPASSLRTSRTSDQDYNDKISSDENGDKIKSLTQLIDSLDEGQLQRLIDALDTQKKGVGKSGKRGWLEAIRSPLMYIGIFVLLRYFK